MNIGIRLHDTLGNTLREHLANAREQGFTCAHLALSKTIPGFRMKDAPELLTDELATEIRETFQEFGLQLTVLGCYLNVAHPSEEEYLKTLEIYKAHLRFAAKCGALCVGTETGAPNPEYRSEPACWTQEALDLFVQRFEPIVRCAEETGALLCLEPVCRHIVSTPERTRQVLERLPSDHLKVILDWGNLLTPANFHQSIGIFDESVRLFGDRVLLLHLKDCRYDATATDLGHLSCACGTGELDFTAPLTFLRGHPGMPATLEDTRPDNARSARLFLEEKAAAL